MIIPKEAIESVCYKQPCWKYDPSAGKESGHCTSNPRECEAIYDYLIFMNESSKLKKLEVKLNGI